MAKTHDLTVHVKLVDEHKLLIKRAAERTALDELRAAYVDASARWFAADYNHHLAFDAARDAARALVAALDGVRADVDVRSD